MINPVRIIRIRPYFHWIPRYRKIGSGHQLTWLVWWFTFDWSWWKYRHMNISQLVKEINKTVDDLGISRLTATGYRVSYIYANDYRILASEYGRVQSLRKVGP